MFIMGGKDDKDNNLKEQVRKPQHGEDGSPEGQKGGQKPSVGSATRWRAPRPDPKSRGGCATSELTDRGQGVCFWKLLFPDRWASPARPFPSDHRQEG